MCLVLVTALLCGAIVKMAALSSEGRRGVQDSNEGEWNGGHKRARIMI